MAKEKFPVTPAIRFLRQQKVEFGSHLYSYEERGGTEVSSRELGVPEHQVIKTLVLEDEQSRPMLVLMHGDRQVSLKELARVIGVKRVSPCEPKKANKFTGYQVGGISPFGTKRKLPVYLEESILALPRILINGGKRGYLVSMDPGLLPGLVSSTNVNVGLA